MTAAPTLLIWMDEADAVATALSRRVPDGAVTVLRAPHGIVPDQTVLDRAEIVFAWDLPDGVIARMPRLKWIQAATGGVENWTRRGDMAGVVLTCARGIHRVQMPENILAAVLHVTKAFGRCREAQEQRQWSRLTFDLVAGKTLGIVGLGAIGAELARKAAALEMRVIGVRKTPQPTPFVEAVYPLAEIDAVLSQSDHVVLVVPVTPETDSLVDAARLSRMKPGAWLHNFARGEIVVDADLIAAVTEGRIAGAVLDAFRQEPLPTEHPFWSTPNILVLPHVGGRHPSKHESFGELLAENISRWVAGEPLQGVVDVATGY